MHYQDLRLEIWICYKVKNILINKSKNFIKIKEHWVPSILKHWTILLCLIGKPSNTLCNFFCTFNSSSSTSKIYPHQSTSTSINFLHQSTFHVNWLLLSINFLNQLTFFFKTLFVFQLSMSLAWLTTYIRLVDIHLCLCKFKHRVPKTNLTLHLFYFKGFSNTTIASMAWDRCRF